MRSRGKAIFGVIFVAFFVAVLPARGESGNGNSCTSSQTVAVQCFVKNAVQTNLMTVPAGWSLTQYQAYGVAVSNILQTHHTYLVTFGIASAVADAMPPTSANGSANQAAQDTALNAMVDAALNNFLVNLPVTTSADQLKQFARDVCMAVDQNDGVTLSPGTVLKLLDSYVVTATSGGTVDWTTVDNSISAAIDALVQNGLLKIPSSVQPIQVKQFAYQVAQAIYAYKTATGRTTL